jgi:hypothetical protein
MDTHGVRCYHLIWRKINYLSLWYSSNRQMVTSDFTKIGIFGTMLYKTKKTDACDIGFSIYI